MVSETCPDGMFAREVGMGSATNTPPLQGPYNTAPGGRVYASRIPHDQLGQTDPCAECPVRAYIAAGRTDRVLGVECRRPGCRSTVSIRYQPR